MVIIYTVFIDLKTKGGAWDVINVMGVVVQQSSI